MPHPVLDAAARFRQGLINREATRATALVNAYGRAYRAMQGQIAALEQQIAGMESPGRADVVRLASLRSLTAQVSDEVNRFATFADQSIANAVSEEIVNGLRESRNVVESYFASPQGRAALRASWDMLPAEAVETMLGMVDEGSPLRSALVNRLGPTVAERMANHLIDAITLGMNPRQTADLVRREMGVGLTWALTTARTAQLWAYREATRANYVANNNIVESWTWLASLDDRTCFPAGTLITTRRGSVPIEEVTTDDQVLTHTGQYRRVMETMKRVHCGDMVEIVAGDYRVVCTPEHPLYVERQGQLDWVEARNVRLTDSIVCKIQDSTQHVDHAFGDITIQSSVRDANNSITPGLQPKSFAGITVFDRFLVVPVSAINFKYGVNGGQKEINRVAPAGESVFLRVLDTKRFKAQPDVTLRSGFTSEPPITPERAKGFIVCGDGSKVFAASWTGFYDGWASTFLGTIVPVFFGSNVENLSATLARQMLTDNGFAFLTTNSIPFGVGFGDRKRLSTGGASLGDLLRVVDHAGARAILTLFSTSATGPKRLFADWTNLFRTLFRCATRCATVGIRFLMDAIAFCRTKLPPAALDCARRYGEFFAADMTRASDFLIVSLPPPYRSALFAAKRILLGTIANIDKCLFAANRAGTNQFSTFSGNIEFVHECLSPTGKGFNGLILPQMANNDKPKTIVYNIEVEKDHSYIANGMVVHNCLSCIAQHGSVHRVTETLNDHHNGRCVQIPNIRGAQNLGIQQPAIESGEQWFNALPEATQRLRMGPGMFAAWRANEFRFGELSQPYNDQVYGTMLREASLSGLLGNRARQYYVGQR